MTKWRASAALRLAIGYATALAVGMAVLGAVVFLAMHVAFTRQLDATVTDEVRTLATEFRSDGGGELSDAIAQRESSTSPGRLLYAVFAPDGRRIAGSLGTARPALGFQDINFIDPREGPDSARGLAVGAAVIVVVLPARRATLSDPGASSGYEMVSSRRVPPRRRLPARPWQPLSRHARQPRYDRSVRSGPKAIS